MMKNLYPVIIAGGSGTRLWPISREAYPKQFNKIFAGSSLFEKALARNNFHDKELLVITNEQHRYLAADQTADVGLSAKIILEPVGRDSFAACLIAALQTVQENTEAIILVAPADHLIAEAEYRQTIEQAYQVASEGKFVTLGITPTFPHIGYGYIEQGDALAELHNVCTVKKFHEKPAQHIAQKYLAAGNFLWNAGIFLFPVKQFLEEARTLYPELVKLAEQALNNAEQVKNFTKLATEYFSSLEKISVDYAILEKSQNIAVIKSNFAWNDVGSWDSYMKVFDQDVKNNVVEANVKLVESKNNCIKSDNDKLIVTIGIEDLVIVNTDDALLVSKKGKSAELKKQVAELQQAEYSEVKNSAEERRPWGSFKIINQGKRYKAKKLVINPGQKISLQYHHKRSEHWVVVEGTAKVTLGDQEKILSENESIYIPKTVKHRVENIGEADLKIIEVQTGAYLGEDDIVRIKDTYHR